MGSAGLADTLINLCTRTGERKAIRAQSSHGERTYIGLNAVVELYNVRRSGSRRFQKSYYKIRADWALRRTDLAWAGTNVNVSRIMNGV